MRMIAALFFSLYTTAILANALPTQPHVYVEGSASIDVVPDRMTFTISLSKVADTVAAAKNDVDTRSTALIDVLKNVGVSPKNIAATTLSVNPATEYKDGQRIPIGSKVSRQIEITITNLDLYPAVMHALVTGNISETVDTRLFVSDEKAMTDQALVAAMLDARKRAERLASTQGRKLGEVYSISEFMTRRDERYLLQVSRRVEGQASGQVYASLASPPHEPFEIGVMQARAEVYVVYYLK